MAENQAVLTMYIVKLNEHCQRRRLKLDYKELGFDGPPHNRVFTVAVEIDGRQYSQATGKTKKEAKAHAALLAWESIQEEQQAQLPPLSSPEPAANLPQPAPSSNYIALLKEYSDRNRMLVHYDLLSKSGPDHMPIFHYVCRINGRDLGEGEGNSIQTAKLAAARQAYEKMVCMEVSVLPALSSPYQQCNKLYILKYKPTRKKAKAERSASLTNSPNNSSQSNSEGSSPEASGASVQNDVDLASNNSDGIVFLSSGVFSNGTDQDSSCNSAADKLANQLGALQLIEAATSSQASPKGSAVRPKRRETPLAPKFSNLDRKESKYTINEKFLNDFEDIKKIQSGGYGTVFKAKHRIDGRLLAVKRVKLLVEEEETRGEEESKKEVQALADLDHEHIVRYHNCWIGKDIPSLEDSEQRMQAKCLFIVMEYCEEGTLKDWISKEKAKENYHEDVRIKFQQIVEGVEYIHSKNLIHRDIKPINIFISRNNKIKIGDFGLVTTGVDDLSIQRTAKRGTLLYMAPEQVGSTYGKEVDIFPLGLILFEMLFTFQTHHEKQKILEDIKEGKFPKPFTKKFPREVSLIKKLLSKVPSERPSAPDILRLLKKNDYGPHTC